MVKTTLEISGMMCGMCEAHINDAIRAAFPVKKVQSSRKKGETVILSETSLDPESLKKTIAETGYVLLGLKEEPEEKRSLFGAFLKS